MSVQKMNKRIIERRQKMTKNRKYGDKIVMITRKEVEQYFMSTIERPPTPEQIMIRSEEDTPVEYPSREK